MNTYTTIVKSTPPPSPVIRQILNFKRPSKEKKKKKEKYTDPNFEFSFPPLILISKIRNYIRKTAERSHLP